MFWNPMRRDHLAPRLASIVRPTRPNLKPERPAFLEKHSKRVNRGVACAPLQGVCWALRAASWTLALAPVPGCHTSAVVLGPPQAVALSPAETGSRSLSNCLAEVRASTLPTL